MYYIMLYFITVHYIMLQYIILCCILSYYILSYYAVLYLSINAEIITATLEHIKATNVLNNFCWKIMNFSPPPSYPSLSFLFEYVIKNFLLLIFH